VYELSKRGEGVCEGCQINANVFSRGVSECEKDGMLAGKLRGWTARKDQAKTRPAKDKADLRPGTTGAVQGKGFPPLRGVSAHPSLSFP